MERHPCAKILARSSHGTLYTGVTSNPTWRDLAEDFGFDPLPSGQRKAGPGGMTEEGTSPSHPEAPTPSIRWNQAAFHQADGAGYRLIADLVIALDPKNPQTAARMIPPLGRWKRFDDARAAMMKAELERILAQPGLSRDVTEQASKSLLG